MFRNSKIATTLALLAVGTLTFAATRPLLQEGMEMPKPTEQHQELQNMVGTWEGTITMTMPGMPEAPSPCTEVVTAHGPFWVTTEFNCEFMGMPFVGRAQVGYDDKNGEYTSTWIDNMSSFMSVMKGNKNSDGVLVQTWEAPNMMGEMAPHKSEQVMDGDDHYTMTFWTDGTQSMVIDMKRTAKKAMEAGAPK